MGNNDKKIVVFIKPRNIWNIIAKKMFSGARTTEQNQAVEQKLVKIELYKTKNNGNIDSPTINQNSPIYKHPNKPDNLLVLWDQTVFMNGLPNDIQNFLYNATEVFFLRHTTNEQEQKEVIKKINVFCNNIQITTHEPVIEIEEPDKTFYPKFCDILINLGAKEKAKEKAKECFEELLKEFIKREIVNRLSFLEPLLPNLNITADMDLKEIIELIDPNETIEINFNNQQYKLFEASQKLKELENNKDEYIKLFIEIRDNLLQGLL